MVEIINRPTDCSSSERSSSYSYIFEDPEVSPRVGTEYQVDIPPLLEKSFSSGITSDTSDSYPMDIPIPVTWISDKSDYKRGELMEVSDNHVLANNGGGSLGSENNVKEQVTPRNIDGGIKTESVCYTLDNGVNAEGLQCGVPLVAVKGQKGHAEDRVSRYLVPGLSNDDWKDVEHSSFLLGLYVFGKNLSLVKRFIGSKEMGDVLSYYYGKFFRSRDYRRWSDCRKVKGKRCIYGQRIFMGWRQQVLMSRLSSLVSEECHYMLTEISKLFGDAKMTLEEYVFSLRDKAGITNLIEAVALGKGKKDLTGTAMESTKANPPSSARAEVPSGKACSSLTSDEIVKFLTGDFRLSKARSNDLFWEAVWPRLLARGWHSEQPSDVVYAGSKQSLVFLVPGVKKFSRRLEKGIHYYDSVTDVLNKVASAPSLLELEGNAESDGVQNDVLDPDLEEEEEEVSLNPRRHSYLQPRSSANKQHLMTFTVVDTSLYSGEGRVKVRELRSLPIGPLTSVLCSSLSEESSSNSVEADAVEPYGVENGVVSMVKEEVCSLNNQSVEDPVSENKQEENKEQVSDLNNGLSEHEMLSGSKAKEEESVSDKSVNACQAMDLQCSEDVKPHQMTNSGNADSAATNCKVLSHNAQSTSTGKVDICPIIDGPAQSSLSGGSLGRNKEQVFERNLSVNSHGSKQSVDNSPHDQLVLHKCENISAAKPSSPCEAETSESINVGAGAVTDEAPQVMASRRQSTRNRPSTRVLEAFAYGFLGTSSKRKGGDGSTSTSSRRVRRKTKKSVPLDNVVEDNDSSACQKDANMAMSGESVTLAGHELQVMHSYTMTE